MVGVAVGVGVGVGAAVDVAVWVVGVGVGYSWRTCRGALQFLSTQALPVLKSIDRQHQRLYICETAPVAQDSPPFSVRACPNPL